MHDGLADRACMSPTRFADVNASSSTVFKETNFMSTVSRGSNGGPVSARNTTSRSHEGIRCLSGTLRRLTPAIKRDARGWLPGDLPLIHGRLRWPPGIL